MAETVQNVVSSTLNYFDTNIKANASNIQDIIAGINKVCKTNLNEAEESQTITEIEWSKVKEHSESGAASVYYNIGDQFIETWKDTANNKSYECPINVVDFQTITLKDGSTRPAMILQWAYATPMGIQFSQYRGFWACKTEALPAGTYYFTIESSWGSNVSAGDVVCFTTTKEVPVGGVLAGCRGCPDQAKSNWRIYTYSSNRKTILETITPTFAVPDSGTNLGTMHSCARNGNLNCLQEMGYGCNRWYQSAIRQWLNSEETKGNWWTPQDDWDVAPDQLNSYDGFLCGVSSSLKAVLTAYKQTTLKNTVTYDGSADVTYDKITLPSPKQMFYNLDQDDSDYFEYWKQVSKAESPLALYTNFSQMITYAIENHTSAQYVRLRSAGRGTSCSAWHVYSSGYCGSWYAAGLALRCAPVFAV